MFVLKVYCFQHLQGQILLQLLLSGRLMKFLKIFPAFTIGLVNQLILMIFFANLFVNMSKEKISKTELLTRELNNNKQLYICRKGVITASKVYSVLTKMNKILKHTGGCVDMWSSCQNISGLSFTNPDLPALKYGQIMEMEATNQFVELMKKKR